MTTSSTDWISFSDVMARAKALYIKAGTPDFEVERDAQNLLIRRLASGEVQARARYYDFKIAYYLGAQEVTPWEQISLEHDGTVPLRFWSYLFDCRMKPYSSSNWIDWPSGDFSFSWDDGTATCEGAAHRIEVRKTDIEALDLPAPEALPHVESDDRRPERKGGRPPATWWAGFAEELAILINFEGHSEASEMFENIAQRMMNRGLKEPTRSSAMEVLGKIIKRISESEN